MKNNKRDILSHPEIDILLVKKDAERIEDLHYNKTERDEFRYTPQRPSGKGRKFRPVIPIFSIVIAIVASLLALFVPDLINKPREKAVRIGPYEISVNKILSGGETRMIVGIERAQAGFTSEESAQIRFIVQGGETIAHESLPLKAGEKRYVIRNFTLDDNKSLITVIVTIGESSITVSQ